MSHLSLFENCVKRIVSNFQESLIKDPHFHLLEIIRVLFQREMFVFRYIYIKKKINMRAN